MEQEKSGCFSAVCGSKKNAAQKLAETARDLFYRHGIRATGIDEIVNEAGVTKPSLYRSFGSKDELVTACLRQAADERRVRWNEVVSRSAGNPRAQLSDAIASFAESSCEDASRGCPLTNAAVEFPDHDHPVHKLSHEIKQEMRQALLDIIKQLPAENPEVLADGLFLLFEGAATSRNMFCGQGPITALVPAAEALIDASLAKSPAPAA